MSERSDLAFCTQANTQGAKEDVPGIGIGMLGYAFMGRAHTNALKKIPYTILPAPYVPELVAICGRDGDAVRQAAKRYGYERATTDWRDLVNDDRIQIFDNGAPPDAHLEPTIAAAQAGKQIICEKPLGRNADESYAIWSAVERTGVKHMCAFNYRFCPAVRLARQIIDSGEIGELLHFHGRYQQEWLLDAQTPVSWRLQAEHCGSGPLSCIGSHVIDQSRYLVGEPAQVTGALTTFVKDRPGGPVTVDDAFSATVQFENGAIGTYAASRYAAGRKNQMTWEINGTKGTICFDLERMNELQLHVTGTTPVEHGQGFRTILVSESYHPYWEHWWPHGHMIGWEDSFVHELAHLLEAIRHDTPIGPHGATLEDGYRCSEVTDAIQRAADTGERQAVVYRSL